MLRIICSGPQIGGVHVPGVKKIRANCNRAGGKGNPAKKGEENLSRRNLKGPIRPGKQDLPHLLTLRISDGTEKVMDEGAFTERKKMWPGKKVTTWSTDGHDELSLTGGYPSNVMGPGNLT